MKDKCGEKNAAGGQRYAEGLRGCLRVMGDDQLCVMRRVPCLARHFGPGPRM